MKVGTKSTDVLYFGKKDIQKLIENERKKRLQKCLSTLLWLKDKIENQMKENPWLKIRNKNVYYNAERKLVIENYISDTISDYRFAGFNGRLMTWDEVKFLFYDKRSINPLIDHDINRMNVKGNNCYWVSYLNQSYEYIMDIDNASTRSKNSTSAMIRVCSKGVGMSELAFFLKNKMTPDSLSVDEEKWFQVFSDLYTKHCLVEYNNDYSFSDEFIKDILTGKYDSLNDCSFEEETILEEIKSKPVQLKEMEELEKIVLEKFLNCDYQRAEIEPYVPRCLFDIGKGHWDLWEMENEEGAIPLKTDTTFVARDPRMDIHLDGIIGIDFGTKSTVVVFQDGSNQILPVRVGNGKYKKEPKPEDYENPTVMEFINLENFMKCYLEKDGRPETLWEDLTVSHKAAEQLKDEHDSSRFYTFFSDLKQWCGDKNRQFRIKDCQDFEKDLKPFLEIDESDINPVEIYAYYLGLFINNMHRGIYLNYILSFPVTYEKKVREKIIESFEKGIRKSLPETVLNDEESMKLFRVQQRAYEPAAYAICALQQYGFEPDEGEVVFYGIFDFGGGTTDFDFGTWEYLDDGRHDNKITHFGAGGDQFLGGENLLEMLAFHVFKKNKEKLRQADISFYRPTECEDFMGSEALVGNSQEAKLNTKQLMEKLRGLWQNDSPEDIEAVENGEIRLMLFTNAGDTQPSFSLEVNKEELLRLLRARIEKGVQNFFSAMCQTFSRDELRTAKGINIFLAGNSSKSPIVKELFEQYSINYAKEILKKEEVTSEEWQEFFHIFPPLGTEEAVELQKSRGVDFNVEFQPTGKTGVAYGLIHCAPNSRIKVVSEIKETDEVKFKYYVGRARKGKFRLVIGRDNKYGEWKKLYDAAETDFEFYYTSLPEAASNQLSVTETKKKICRIEKANEDEQIGIYLRAVEPTVIEYAVATEDGIQTEEYLEEPRRVELP